MVEQCIRNAKVEGSSPLIGTNLIINLFVAKTTFKCYDILCNDRGGILDFVITFFRDILDGPLYIAIVIINSILICSCIGYLGERYLNHKKIKGSYVDINVSNNQKL